MNIKTNTLLLLTMIAALGASAFSFWQEPAPSENKHEKVLVLPLHDDGYMVDQVQADFLIERLKRAEEEGFTRIILKIDTYGGVVFSARDITEQLIRMKIPTTAYVETKAISAGAFIAWACDEIVMQEHTTIGDAQMIYQTMEGGIEEAPEKMVTVFRSDWQKLSEAKGRSFALAQGFFDQSVEVLRVGDDDHFEFILRDDYDRLPVDERPRELEVVSKAGQLLTLHAEKAEELHLVQVFPDYQTFLDTRGYRDTHSIDMTINQQILRLLGVNSWIFFLLTLIGLNGIYMEIKAPGFGIPGFTAIVCFTLVLGSRYLLGTASILELLIFVLGIGLCVVEIFVLPGLGVVGLTGILCMFGALVLASFPDFGGLPSYDLQYEWLTSLSLNMIAVFLASILTLVFLLPRLFKLPGARRGVLQNEMRAEDGFVLDTGSQYRELTGHTGVAVGDLRPVGKIRLADGTLLDVTSGSDFIPADTHIRIAAIEGNRILVQPVGLD